MIALCNDLARACFFNTIKSLAIHFGTPLGYWLLKSCGPEALPSRATFKELVMDWFDFVGLACAVGLFAYMLYALFKPERF
jgi:K+-transporting ATPase KdpF subunit